MIPLRPKNSYTRIKEDKIPVRRERRKPNQRGAQIYVGVAPNPPQASESSPPFLNNFTYLSGHPIWFAHGLDGETDMGGQYDLVTNSPVSGNIAFVMPMRWAQSLPPATMFPVELTDGTWTLAIQTCTLVPGTGGQIRIFWPIVADPIL